MWHAVTRILDGIIGAMGQQAVAGAAVPAMMQIPGRNTMFRDDED